MAIMNCPKCRKEIEDKEFFCPYCNCPIEDEENDDVEDEAIPEKQSGFGIASFTLAVIAAAIMIGRLSGNLAPYTQVMMRMWQNILAVIAFVFGCVGMFSKHRKSGFAVIGNVIAFILFWI